MSKKSLNKHTSLEEEFEEDGKVRKDEGYIEWKEWKERDATSRREKEERLRLQRAGKEYWALHRECTAMMAGNRKKWLERREEENRRKAEEDKAERLSMAKKKSDSARRKAKDMKGSGKVGEDSRRLETKGEEEIQKKKLKERQKFKESLWKQRREKDEELVTNWKIGHTRMKPPAAETKTSPEEEFLEEGWMKDEGNNLRDEERKALEELEKKRCILDNMSKRVVYSMPEDRQKSVVDGPSTPHIGSKIDTQTYSNTDHLRQKPAENANTPTVPPVHPPVSPPTVHPPVSPPTVPPTQNCTMQFMNGPTYSMPHKTRKPRPEKDKVDIMEDEISHKYKKENNSTPTVPRVPPPLSHPADSAPKDKK